MARIGGAQSIPSEGASVQVPKAADLVAATIRREIVRGTIADREPLPSEAQFMERFGVSRPTLREALRILESEGLVSVRRGPSGGSTAHKMSPQLVSRYALMLLQSRGGTVSDVYQAQNTFEPACVRELAESRSSSMIATLRETVEHERCAMRDGDDPVERIEFHHALIELSGNQTLLLLSEMITYILIAAAAVEYPIGLDQQRAFADHESVVELIAAGDADGAQDLWRRHLEGAMNRVLGQLGGDRKLRDLLG